MDNNEQISARGIAQQSGLEIFSSIINYTGQYVNWSIADSAIGSSPPASVYTTTATNPYTDSLINNPPNVVNAWYYYYTSGSPYTAAQSPAFAASVFALYGQKTGGNPSYSGIYQKLSLVTGKDYQINIRKSDSTLTGTIIVQVYTPSEDEYTLVLDTSYATPVIATTEAIFSTEFTAVSANDILMVSFTTDYSAGMAGITIPEISIQEKQEYLIPVYANDRWGNAHKVLRRNLGNPRLNE
tara:strand:- start:489 stop:1211 length:723 start_codon:yes stop_codon:yes gene_type:complete